LLSGFHWIFAQVWIQETFLSHFFAARNPTFGETTLRQAFPFGFTKVTYFKLFLLVLVLQA
jgi:hypothetical protein